MAKYKSKKYSGNKKYTTPRKPTTPPSAVSAAPKPAVSKPTTGKAAAASAKEVDFRTEYRYVLGDLKRIGILAASMFAMLVVLALIVR